MASQGQGFNQNIASLSSHALKKQERKAFTEALNSFKVRSLQEWSGSRARQQSPDEDDDWLPSAVEFSRRVLLPTNQPLQVNQILKVNNLYSIESRALNTAQRLTLQAMASQEEECGQEVFTGEELVEQFQAVHNKIRSTTDRLTKFLGLTRSMGATEDDADAIRFIHRDGEVILNEFFAICQVPNQAEELMLATVCNIHSVFIRGWFKVRRNANLKFFHATATARDKGSVAQLYRKQREQDASRF